MIANISINLHLLILVKIDLNAAEDYWVGFGKLVLFLRPNPWSVTCIGRSLLFLWSPVANIHRFPPPVIGVRRAKILQFETYKYRCSSGITSRKYDGQMQPEKIQIRWEGVVEVSWPNCILHLPVLLFHQRAKLRRINHSLWEFYAAFYCIFSAATKFVRVCHNVSSLLGRSGTGGFLVTHNFKFHKK